MSPLVEKALGVVSLSSSAVVVLWVLVSLGSNIWADSQCRALGYVHGGTDLFFRPWCSIIRSAPKPPTTMSLEEARRRAK